MNYEFDNLDLALLAKCRESVNLLKNGYPLRDVMDQKDFENLVFLLVDIMDAEQ